MKPKKHVLNLRLDNYITLSWIHAFEVAQAVNWASNLHQFVTGILHLIYFTPHFDIVNMSDESCDQILMTALAVVENIP